MKKKIRLILFFIIIVLIVAFFCSQINNIKGFIYSFKYSGDEIETMLTDNDIVLKEQVENFLGHSIREFTAEEQRQIKEGVATQDELVEKIIAEEIEKSLTTPSDDKPVSSSDDKKPDAKTKDGKNQTTTVDPSMDTSGTPPSAASPSDAAKYITELYNLKSEYIGKLDGMVDSAVKEFRALPKKEKTYSKQLQIGASYMTKALALESECDKKVAAIVSSLEKQLKSEGKSTAIITVINDTYNSEKTLKRAYYLNMFK